MRYNPACGVGFPAKGGWPNDLLTSLGVIRPSVKIKSRKGKSGTYVSGTCHSRVGRSVSDFLFFLRKSKGKGKVIHEYLSCSPRTTSRKRRLSIQSLPYCMDNVRTLRIHSAKKPLSMQLKYRSVKGVYNILPFSSCIPIQS
jgi:hypothetical protein